MGEQKTPAVIVGLTASNFKRLVAVEVSPAEGEPLVTVGGQNEAGKSSVLDAVATVLGGKDLAPKVPIRKGQDKAEISATLSDGLLVTRKFKRGPALDGEPETITSTLEITNADGSATFKSPQAMLDRLLGGAAFYDPLAFAQLRPAERREAVRKLLGLDFEVQDARRRKLLDDKLGLSRKLESAERAIEGVKPYDGVPEEPVDPADLLREIEAAENTQAAAKKAEHVHSIAESELRLLHEFIQERDVAVERAREALKNAEAEAASARASVPNMAREVDEALENLKLSNDNKIDPAPLKAKMAEVKGLNEKVAFNKDLAKTEAAVNQLRLELATTNEAIALVDAEKREALERAPFPVPGMSFADDDVLLDGLPFSQASTARKLRVSVAMALTRAGALRVLLVKAGNDLDTKNLALLAEIAREHQAQVWVERVADDPASVTVFIEDGSSRS